jgi:hypothetical protein
MFRSLIGVSKIRSEMLHSVQHDNEGSMKIVGKIAGTTLTIVDTAMSF